jgi:hypothetical protein
MGFLCLLEPSFAFLNFSFESLDQIVEPKLNFCHLVARGTVFADFSQMQNGGVPDFVEDQNAIRICRMFR